MQSAFLAFIAAAGLVSVYIAQNTSKLRQSIDLAKTENVREGSQNNKTSSFATLRAMLHDSKRGASYGPTLYPGNYFADAWNLAVDGERAPADLKVNAANVQLKSFPEEIPLGKIPSGEASPIQMTETIKLSLQALNYHPDHPYLVQSADFKAEDIKGASSPMTARIPLDTPRPQGLKLLVKGPGISGFQDITTLASSHLPGGSYTFRLLGSGVVYFGELNIDGQSHILGFEKASQKISHDANNIKAVDALIGDLTLDVKPTAPAVPGIGFDGCSIAVTDASGGGWAPVSLSAKLFAVDESEATEFSLSLTLQVGSKASDDTASGGSCGNSCPLQYGRDFKGEGQGGNENQHIAKFFSKSLAGSRNPTELDLHEDAASDLLLRITKRSGVICSNMELAAGYMKKKSGKDPEALYKQSPEEFERLRLEGLPFKRYYAYLAPECERQLVGVRSDCGCFAEDSQITMADGSQAPVQSLRAGDWVWNPKAKRAQVIRRVVMGPEKKPMWKVRTAGHQLLVTEDHPFLSTAGLRMAKELRPGDVLLGESSLLVSGIEQVAANNNSYPNVWNIELEGSDAPEDHFVEANGIMTGDLFLQEKRAKAEGKK